MIPLAVKEIADAIEAEMGPIFGSPERLADPEWLARHEASRRKTAEKYAWLAWNYIQRVPA